MEKLSKARSSLKNNFITRIQKIVEIIVSGNTVIDTFAQMAWKLTIKAMNDKTMNDNIPRIMKNNLFMTYPPFLKISQSVFKTKNYQRSKNKYLNSRLNILT
jgi:hypothetical protein